MRGKDEGSGSLFSYVDLEARVPRGHPLRAIRDLTNAALSEMSGEFEALYSRTGRPGIAPEKLLRTLLLQAFYSIRSERQLMEQLEFNLLFRWFVGLGIDDRVWDATVFTKNRERLLAGDVASRFLAPLVSLPAVKRLLLQEHSSVDGTQIEAWASIKSFRAVDEEPLGEDATEIVQAAVAMPPATSMVRAGRTRRTARLRMTITGSTARGRARKRSSATWAMR